MKQAILALLLLLIRCPSETVEQGVGGASVWLRGPYQGQHVSLTSLRGISSKTETFKLD